MFVIVQMTRDVDAHAAAGRCKGSQLLDLAAWYRSRAESTESPQDRAGQLAIADRLEIQARTSRGATRRTELR